MFRHRLADELVIDNEIGLTILFRCNSTIICILMQTENFTWDKNQEMEKKQNRFLFRCNMPLITMIKKVILS